MHELTLEIMRIIGENDLLRRLVGNLFYSHSHHNLHVDAFGLRFPNPVGLAAGYDKDGRAWQGLSTLGFGHIEIGTVTPHAQEGNQKPRVFRLPKDDAVINRMGFPGRGAEYVYEQLLVKNQHRYPQMLGVNIGKNKDTPNQEAAGDYVHLLQKFHPVADFLTINVSSPNTVGLRRLQAREYLLDLLFQLHQVRLKMEPYKPILVKISPDLTQAELEDVIDAILRTKMDGIVATNTTLSRERLRSHNTGQAGGLSGRPLLKRSKDMVSQVHRLTEGKLPVVGVGGIMNPDDAKAMLDAGAILVQLYTGLVYSGPGLVRRILQQMASERS
jgi:dihydroorotate dehydrogenase